MELIKKIWFFVIILLTLTNVSDIISFAIHERQYVVECSIGEQAKTNDFLTDLDDCHKEDQLINLSSYFDVFSISQYIYTVEFVFLKKFNLSFWQPPKIS